jgi:hypothetical protein
MAGELTARESALIAAPRGNGGRMLSGTKDRVTPG